MSAEYKKPARRQPKRQQPPGELDLFIGVSEIVEPAQPKPGQTPMERLDDVCLEICQKSAFGGSDAAGRPDPETKLVSASTLRERKEMLRLAEETGVGVEGLVQIIRRNHGVQKPVFRELERLGGDK